MNLDDALPGFITEATELLGDMEGALLKCAAGPPDADTINLIFRAAHTIKGSAGLFGLDGIVSFVHVVETVLDRVRLNQIALDDELVRLMLECKDHIQSLVEAVFEPSAGNAASTERN